MSGSNPLQLKYSYKDVPTIKEFSQSKAFIRGLMGPVGGGKSVGCIIEIVKLGHAQRPGPDGIKRTRWVVIRNTFAELKDTTIKTVMEWLPPDIFGDYHATDHNYTIRGFKGVVIEIMFRALDRPDHVKKLLSLEVTGAWVNEARQVPWAIIDVLQSRLGRYPRMIDGGCSWFGLIMDTNPPDADSKWYNFFEEADHSEDVDVLNTAVPGLNLTVENYCSVFKQPSGLSGLAENLPNLQPGYYQRLAIGKSPEWVKVYIKGDYGFIMEGLPVFPEYSDALHLGECKTLKDLPVYRSWDYGLTPACVFSQITPGGQFITVDEMVSTSMGITRFAERVIEHSKGMFPRREFIDIGDPAGNTRAQTDETTCFEIQRALGIDIQPAPQTLSIRLESMRKPLNRLSGGRPGFVLHPRCKTLRRAFLGGYHYKKMGSVDGEFQRVPNKNHFSHCFPAGTMVEAVSGLVSIENIQVGDWVMTPLGFQPVTAVMDREVTSLVSVKFRSGHQVTCTLDHPIMTQNGFAQADGLTYSDCGYVRENALWDDQLSIQSRFSMASNIIGSLKGIIRLILKKAFATCTGISGSTTTGQSQKDLTSIIVMRTKLITRFPTLSFFRTKTIRGFIWFLGTLQIQSEQRNLWTRSGLLHRLGIGLRKAGNGTLSMLQAWCDPQRISLATTAAYLSPRNCREGKPSAAAINAGQASGAKVGLMMSPETVPFAGHPLSQIDTEKFGIAARVVGLTRERKDRPVKVYDLTVANAHAFYANGVLVSNCMDAQTYIAAYVYGDSLVSLSGDRRGMDDEDSLVFDTRNPTKDRISGY